MLIGIISDTHGFIAPSAIDVLKKTDLIIHSGDIGNPGLLKKLASIADTIAVRGNMDIEPWAQKIPKANVVQVENHFIYVLHDIEDMELDPVASGFHAVISGHTHRPELTKRDAILYINPGSVSHPRGNHPPTLALLTIDNDSMSVRHIELKI